MNGGGRYLAFAVFTVGASLACGVDDADPVGGGCSNDPKVITCEQLLAGQVRGDHPTYTIYYDASPCDQDDIACFEEATGVPVFELDGYYFSVRSSDLPALCMGPFAPRISSLVADVDAGRCYELGQSSREARAVPRVTPDDQVARPRSSSPSGGRSRSTIRSATTTFPWVARPTAAGRAWYA